MSARSKPLPSEQPPPPSPDTDWISSHTASPSSGISQREKPASALSARRAASGSSLVNLIVSMLRRHLQCHGRNLDADDAHLFIDRQGTIHCHSRDWSSADPGRACLWSAVCLGMNVTAA